MDACVLRGNDAWRGGGVMLEDSSKLNLTASALENNVADVGGGIFFSDPYAAAKALMIHQSSLEGNKGGNQATGASSVNLVAFPIQLQPGVVAKQWPIGVIHTFGVDNVDAETTTSTPHVRVLDAFGQLAATESEVVCTVSSRVQTDGQAALDMRNAVVYARNGIVDLSGAFGVFTFSHCITTWLTLCLCDCDNVLLLTVGQICMSMAPWAPTTSWLSTAPLVRASAGYRSMCRSASPGRHCRIRVCAPSVPLIRGLRMEERVCR
jgi:hypothetical protein